MTELDFGALLNIPNIKVVRTEMNSHGHFMIYAESTKIGTTCHVCGK